MLNYLDQHSGLSILVAFIIAFLSWIFSTVRESRNKCRQKRNLLEAIKLEIEFDASWIQDLIPQGEDAARYYDPTRADFRLRDDAITYAITNGQSILLADKDFIKTLISVSHAVRFVNQQIEEQMMTRFCSPEFSSRMSSLVINNQKIIYEWFKNKSTIPVDLKEYSDELHLRHRAINNVGFWQQLRPSLQKAIPVVTGMINDMDSNKKWWNFWKS